MNHKIIIIGIAGASASGKTVLSKTIAQAFPASQVIVIPEDAYYKPQDHLSLNERSQINFDHPNSLDHALLAEHLGVLLQGKSIHIPVYDFTTHSRSSETHLIGQQTIIIVEGILLFAEPRLCEKMDIKIFMDTPLDICLVRRLRRDIQERGRTVESVLTQYEKTVRPMYMQFIEPSKRYADIIVPRGGENAIAIDMIQAKMRELLEANGKTE